MNNQELYKKIIIISRGNNIYLHNKLTEPIEQLVYETFSMLTTDEVIGISSTPTYELLNIPADTAVFIEELDAWEDGKIYYNLLKLKSKQHHFDGKFNLKTISLSGLVPLPKIVDINKVKLSTSKGFLVDIQEDIINKLYWFAEDLVAYTDLKGEQFDTESAQRRLWKMNIPLKEIENNNLSKLYAQLDEQLENPAFFNKIEFSETLQSLFSKLQDLKNL